MDTAKIDTAKIDRALEVRDGLKAIFGEFCSGVYLRARG